MVPAGEYTIFTIFDKNEVTFILNKAINIWGAYSYKPDNDILRYTVPINKVKKSLEAFSIAVGEQNEILGINFGWEYIRFKIPITLL